MTGEALSSAAVLISTAPKDDTEGGLDPVWFPIWADIIIPTFVGLATVAVAVAAIVASSRAQKLARLANEQAEILQARKRRSDFIHLLESKEKRPTEIARAEIVTGHGAELIDPWITRQKKRFFKAGKKGTDPTTLTTTPGRRGLSALMKQRMYAWVETGNFDVTDVDLNSLTSDP